MNNFGVESRVFWSGTFVAHGNPVSLNCKPKTGFSVPRNFPTHYR